MKNDPDRYYFTRLDSEDADIMWSKPSENLSDVKPNEKLLKTPVPLGCTTWIVQVESHARRIEETHQKYHQLRM